MVLFSQSVGKYQGSRHPLTLDTLQLDDSPEGRKAVLREIPERPAQLTPDLPIDIKTLFQIAADASLKKTPYNGSTQSVNAKIASEFLKQLITLFPDKDFKGIAEGLGLLEDIQNDSVEKATDLATVTKLAREMNQKVATLQIGDSIAISGGHSDKSGGHAMIYKVTRELNGSYTFTIYNTGDGVRFHEQKTTGLKVKHATALKFTGCDLERHLSDVFFTAIFYMNSSVENREQTSSDDLYTLLFDNFSGCRQETDHQELDFQTQQRSGSCAVKASWAMLYDILPRKTYKFAKLMLTYASCEAMLNPKYKSSFTGNTQAAVEARSIGRTAARNLAHKALKMREKGGKDYDVYQQAAIIAQHLLMKMDEYEVDDFECFSKKRVAIASPSDFLQRATRPVGKPLPDQAKPETLFRNHPAIDIPHYNRQSDIDREAILAKLDEMHGSRGLIANQIEEYIDGMPIPVNVDGVRFWEGVNRSRAEDLGSLFTALLTRYTSSLPYGRRTAKQRNTVHAMYIFIQHLTSKFNRDMAGMFGVKGLIDEKSPSQLFLSGQDFERHEIIRRYEEAHLTEDMAYDWRGNFTPFRVEDLPAPLRVFWPLYQQHKEKIIKYEQDAHDKHIANGGEINQTLQKYPEIYCFLQSFRKVEACQSSEHYVSALFRNIQKAYAQLSYFESSSEGRSNWMDYGFDKSGDQFAFTQWGLNARDSLLPTTTLVHTDRGSLGREERRDTEHPIYFKEVEEDHKANYFLLHPDTQSMRSLFFRHAVSNEALRPVDLMHFATRHFESTRNTSWRVIFEHQLFKADRSQDKTPQGPLYEAMRDPHFHDATLKFFHSHRHTVMEHVTSENIDQAIFSVKTAISILHFAHKYKAPAAFIAQLREHIDFLLDNVELGNFSGRNQAKFHMMRAYYQSELLLINKEDKAKLAGAWCKMHIHSVDLETNDELANLFSLVRERVVSKLPGIIDHIHQQGNLADLSEELFGARGNSIKLDGMLLSVTNDKGQTAYISLSSGQVWDFSGKAYSNISADMLRAQESYRELFPDMDNKPVISQEIESLGIKHKKGIYKASHSSERHKLVLEKLIEGKWCRYIPQERLFGFFGATVNNGRVISQRVPASILTTCDAFIIDDETIHFNDRLTGNLKYTFQNSGLFNKYGKEVRVLVDDTTIQAIEDAAFVHEEENADGERVLTFARFKDLSFIYNARQRKWEWEQDRSYFISSDRISAEVAPFENYLHLETKSGMHLALVPKVPFRESPHNKFEKTLDTCRVASIRDLPIDTRESTTYEAIPLKDLDFDPKGPAQEALAVKIYMMNKQYNKALLHLDNVTLVDVRNSRACFEELFQGSIETSQFLPAPEAIGLRMKMLYLASRSLDQEAKSTAFGEQVKAAYLAYLQNLSNIPKEYRITEHEEQSILQNKVFDRAKSIPSDQTPYDADWKFVTRRLELLRGNPRGDYDHAHLSGINPKHFQFSIIRESQVSNPGCGTPPPKALASFTLEQYVDLIKDPAKNLGTLYETCLELNAGKDRPKKNRAVQILKTAAILFQKNREYTAFLLAVLNRGMTEPGWTYQMAPTNQWRPNYRLEDRQRDGFIEWKHQIRSKLGIGWSQNVTIDAKREAVLLNVERDMTFQPVEWLTPPAMLETKQRHLEDMRKKLSITQQDTSRYLWSQTLREMKTFVEQRCNLQVSYKDEADHFEDLAESVEVEDEAFKLPTKETTRKFLEANERRKIEQAKKRLPHLTTAELDQIIASNKSGEEERNAVLTQIQKEIYAIANYVPVGVEEQTDDALGSAGGLKKDLTLDDLTLLFFSGYEEAYAQANPHLSETMISELHSHLAHFFHLQIEAKQLERLAQKAQELKDIMTNGKKVEVVGGRRVGRRLPAIASTKDALDDQGVPLRPDVMGVLAQLHEVALQKSDYDYIDDPERLLFEYAMRIMLRVEPDQEEKIHFILENIKRDRNCTIGLQMGGGKTTVIATYFLAKMVGNDNIPILLTPSFQYETICSTLRKSLKESSKVELVTFKNHRIELTLDRLKDNLQLLREVQQSPAHLKPKVLVVCPEAIQTMELEFYNLHKIITTCDPDNIPEDTFEKLETLREILTLFKDRGVALGDECHAMLDIIFELNFPTGEAKQLDDKNIKLIGEIMKAINTDDMRETLHIDDNKQQKYFSRERYDREILPQIADRISQLDILGIEEEEEQKQLIRYVKAEMNPNIQRLLLQGRQPNFQDYDGDQEAYEMDVADYNFLVRLRESSSSEDPEIKKGAELVALSKFILSNLLPYILSRKTENESFGRTKDPEFAGEVVPYICLNTPSKNKFGNPYEAVVFHYLTAMIRGVSDDQILYYFEQEEEEAQWYVRNRHMTYDETPSVKRCKELFGIMPREIKSQLAAISDTIKTDERLTFTIERATIDRWVRYHPLRMNSNAMSIVSLMRNFVAMSATPTVGLLHHSLQKEGATEIDEMVNPKVIHAMLSKREDTAFIDSESPADVIRDICAADKEATGLLDLGSQFIDIDNDEVAKELLKHMEERGIDAVVYYTRANGSTTADFPAILRRGEAERLVIADLTPKELAKYGLEPGKFFLFLDNRHCTGIDAPALLTAKYLLYWGTEITLSNATQGIMRLRQFLKDQRIRAVMHRSEAALMPTEEGKKFEELDTKEQYLIMLKQMLLKEAQSVAFKKLKAFRKMLSNACVSAIRGRLLQDAVSNQPHEIKKRQDLIKAAESMIFIDSEDRPFESFGSLEEQQEIMSLLRKEKEVLLANFSRKLTETAPDGHEDIIFEVRMEMAEVIALAEKSSAEFIQLVSKAVDKLDKAGEDEDETEVEALLEIHQEVEIELELEREIEDELQTMQAASPPHEKDRTPFNPYLFWQDFAALGDTPTQCSLYADAFDTFTGRSWGWGGGGQQRYERDYTKAFSDTLFVTEDHIRPYQEKISPLCRAMPPSKYLMVVQSADGKTSRGVLLSQLQAEELKRDMDLHPEKYRNTWVVLPKGHVQAGDPATFDIEKDHIQNLMLETNIIAGNLDYCLQNLHRYKHWLTAPKCVRTGPGADDIKLENVQAIKERFIKLVYAKYRTLLSKDHLKLGGVSTVDQLLERDDKYKIYGELNNVTVEDIQLWGDDKKHFVQCLTKKEQVAALSPELKKHLATHQMPLLEFEDMLLFRDKPKYIAAFPAEAIQKLRKTKHKIDKKFVRALHRGQLQHLRDPKLVPFVEGNKVKFLDNSMVKHIAYRPGLLVDMDAKQFGYLTRAQMQKAIKDPLSVPQLQKIDNSKELAKIVKLGFHDLSAEQFTLLEDEEAILTLPEKYLKKLPPTKIMNFRNSELIGKLTKDQAKYVDADHVTHLNQEAVQGINSRVPFRKLKYSQLRTIDPEQLVLASPKQIVAHVTMTIALAIFSAMVFVPVSIAYLSTKIISCQYFSTAFEFVMASLKRQVALTRFAFKMIINCGRGGKYPQHLDTQWQKELRIQQQQQARVSYAY